MDKVKEIKVPESHIQFAKDVADLAVKHNMEFFQLKYTPDTFHDGDEIEGIYGNANAQIVFRAKDGRGRPCRNLTIRIDSAMEVDIESNPESCS